MAPRPNGHAGPCPQGSPQPCWQGSWLWWTACELALLSPCSRGATCPETSLQQLCHAARCSLSPPEGTSDQDRHSSSLMTPQLPPTALLLAGLQVEKYPGWQAGCTPEWQPTPSAPHPRCFTGVIFSRLAAKSSAERAACLAVFTVWLPAPAHRGPATHHPSKHPHRGGKDGQDAAPGPPPAPQPLARLALHPQRAHVPLCHRPRDPRHRDHILHQAEG